MALKGERAVLGWSYCYLKKHKENFDELSITELAEFREIIRDFRAAIGRAFCPDWFNIMQLGNMTHHLHFHLVPRYAKPRKFMGKRFVDKNYGDMVDNTWKSLDKKFLIGIVKEIKEQLD